MIARTPPTTTTLPASIILGPREQKQYRRWQAQTTTLKPKQQGFLPTAAEYADFQSWLAKRDSGYLSDTPLADLAAYLEDAPEKEEDKKKARTCGHILHPTLMQKAERCPVCTVEMHLTYMKVLTVALEESGGLAKQRWEAVDRDSPALQAWYAGKLAFVRDIDWLESVAEDEKEYDERPHAQDQPSTQATSEAKTASDALSMYWDKMEANPNMMRGPSRKRTCSVLFCPDTSFEQGRDQHYFWRKSPRYEAGGKYASSSECDDEDNEDSQPEEQDSEKQNPNSAVTKRAVTLGEDTEDQSDEGASDLEDDDEENDDDDDEAEDEEDVDASNIIFADDEEIEGADFIVFE